VLGHNYPVPLPLPLKSQDALKRRCSVEHFPRRQPPFSHSFSSPIADGCITSPWGQHPQPPRQDPRASHPKGWRSRGSSKPRRDVFRLPLVRSYPWVVVAVAAVAAVDGVLDLDPEPEPQPDRDTEGSVALWWGGRCCLCCGWRMSLGGRGSRRRRRRGRFRWLGCLGGVSRFGGGGGDGCSWRSSGSFGAG
jgi:hypothetical protein